MHDAVLIRIMVIEWPIAGCVGEILRGYPGVEINRRISLKTRRGPWRHMSCARCQGVFAHGYSGEHSGEYVAAVFSEGAVGHHFKIHASVLGVGAVGLDKLDTTARGVEPLRVFLDIVERKRAYGIRIGPETTPIWWYPLCCPAGRGICSPPYTGSRPFLNPEWHYICP